MKNNGFTLVELVVVMLIVSILSMVAVPAYRSYLVNNAESSVRTRISTLGIELMKWRAKTLSFNNFDAEDSPVTYYSGDDETLSSHEYQITLTYTANTWRLYASPNPSNSSVKNGQQFLMIDNGETCKAPRTNTDMATATACATFTQGWE